MALDDLLAGLSVFKQGLSEYATGQAIGQANDQLSQLRNSGLEEGQKRQQMQQVTQGLSGHLLQMGVDPQRAAATAQSLAPKPFSTPEEMMMYGANTGSESLVQEGIKRQQQFNAVDKTVIAEHEKTVNAYKMNQEKLALEWARLRQEAGKSDLKPLSNQNANMIQQIDNLDEQRKKIADFVQENPDVVGMGAGHLANTPFRSGKKAEFDGMMSEFNDQFRAVNKIRAGTPGATAAFSPMNVGKSSQDFIAQVEQFGSSLQNHRNIILRTAQAQKQDISGVYHGETGTHVTPTTAVEKRMNYKTNKLEDVVVDKATGKIIGPAGQK